MTKRINLRFVVVFLLLHFMAGSAIAQPYSSETDDLREIKQYALRGNDTTLVLLEAIKPNIDFDFKNDRAFEFLKIKSNYYIQNLKKN